VQRISDGMALLSVSVDTSQTNMIMRKGLIILLLGLLSGHIHAQDPEFSQFYASPIYTNPAMAGTGQCDGGGRAVLNYRNQWPKLPGTIVTSAFSWDQHFENVNGSFAVLATHDVAGEGLLTTSALSGIYSYRLEVNRKLTIQWGLEGQYIQRKLDFSKLRFADQIVPSRGFIKITQEQFIEAPIIMPNFSTGMVMFTDKMYAGVAVHNIIEPVQSFYGDVTSVLPRRYTIHGGSRIALDRRKVPQRTISPNILFMLQNKFTQLNFGFYYTERSFVTGLWYRQTFGEYYNSDAMMLLVGFKKDNFKFGYSVDFTVSDAQSAAPVSHEISTSMYWCPKKQGPKYRVFPCAWK
jgi:type IX secretion system PorP/SprF family membrane protein